MGRKGERKVRYYKIVEEFPQSRLKLEHYVKLSAGHSKAALKAATEDPGLHSYSRREVIDYGGEAYTSDVTEINEIEAQEDESGFFVITRLHRDDIIEAFKGNPKAQKRARNMTDDEMKQLASKMADDYLNQLYWSSLRIIFEDRFLGE